MTHGRTFTIDRIGPRDLAKMNAMLTLFGEVFGESETYSERRPPAPYLEKLLAGDSFIALAAVEDGEIIGGLAGYELRKFEQQRSEIYIYDLAVAEPHRRRGVASALIAALQPIAAERGAWVIYVQADHGDEPAIALYTKLGIREDVLHFDIAVERAR